MPQLTPTPIPPSRDTRDLGVVDALMQTSFLLHQVLGEIAAARDLSLIQARLLGVLRDREPRMAELASLLELSKQSVTGLVNRAEGRGLVRRVSIPVGDERAVHVALTDHGRAVAEEIHDEVATRVLGLVADLSDTNRKRVSSLLSRVVIGYARRRGADLDPRNLRIER